jgi:hypothetical protein
MGRQAITETEWLTRNDLVMPSADLVVPHVSDRKLRLFAVACCGLVESHLTDDRSRHALSVAKRHTDGEVDDAELQMANEAAEQAASELQASMWAQGGDPNNDPHCLAAWAVFNACDRPLRPQYDENYYGAGGSAMDFVLMQVSRALSGDLRNREGLMPLLREVVGNPFRPITFEATWRRSTVVALAQAAYDRRDFGSLPVLADALEDAGCDCRELLDHLRAGGLHVRGCWALDLVLGKQ